MLLKLPNELLMNILYHLTSHEFRILFKMNSIFKLILTNSYWIQKYLTIGKIVEKTLIFNNIDEKISKFFITYPVKKGLIHLSYKLKCFCRYLNKNNFHILSNTKFQIIVHSLLNNYESIIYGTLRNNILYDKYLSIIYHNITNDIICFRWYILSSDKLHYIMYHITDNLLLVNLYIRNINHCIYTSYLTTEKNKNIFSTIDNYFNVNINELFNKILNYYPSLISEYNDILILHPYLNFSNIILLK